MKNDARKYLLLGAAACALLVSMGMALLWVMDNVLNGVGIDYLESLVTGTDSDMGAVFFDKSRLSRDLLILIVAIAAALSATGAFCAYSVSVKRRRETERIRAEAERARELAVREMQRKSDLITYLAHDLKTPLASVVAYLSLLDESPELDAAHRAKYTGIALAKANRLEQLIAELFEIIRFNLQNIELDRQTINLRMMLLQMADEFHPIMLAHGAHLTVDCEQGMTVYGDADKLARVFDNILKNAVAYGGEGGEILVTARREGGQTCVRFINHGTRIPEEKLNRIFEKFYRADAARSSQTGGAGLGLAIAREIVEAHGGSIRAQSSDARTEFLISLPDPAAAQV